MLVYSLARKCIGRRRWAAVAGCIFAAHPGHILTVCWNACQTELMVVTFILSATLCYARYSNWPTPMFARSSDLKAGPGVPGGQIGWLLAACGFFVLALGCRENAVVFPVVAVAGDLLLRPRQWRRRLMAYGLFAVLFVVYFALRSDALSGFAMPGKPYLIPPTDPLFPMFVVKKLVYYTIAIFALMPILPIAGLVYFREHMLMFGGTFAVVVAACVALGVVFRHRRGFLLAPLWLLAGMAPVLMLFASPHHLYLPSVGGVLMVAAFWAWALGEFRDKPVANTRARAVVAVVIIAVHAIVLPGTCRAFGWVYRTATEVEDILINEVVDLTPDIQDGDKLFFINIPMMAYYAIPAIEAETGVRDLRGYAMTFSPHLLMMEEPCRLRQIDDRSFSVCLERDGYFGGTMGRSLREAMGRESFFTTGERIACDEFETEVAQASPDGVRELIFRFRKPLTSPGYRFYLGSRYRFAYPVTWYGASTTSMATTATSRP